MDALHFHTALPNANGAPTWVHLLPAGRFQGVDKRGPYEVVDPQAVITHSMQANGGKLPIDENHATDRAAENGGSAPAAGWIVELQSRADGIWGRVDWTKSGRALVEDNAYRGISPAFRAPGGKVSIIERASLTNLANLELTHLHNREPRMELADLRRRLRLADTATQAEVEIALDRAGDALTLHSRVATIVGLTATATPDAIVTGLRAKTEGVETHAQQQIAALQTEVTTLKAAGSRAKAESALREASESGVIITDEVRDALIELHMKEPDAAERIIKGMPKVGAPLQLHTRKAPVAQADDAMVAQAAAAWGQKPEDVRATMGVEV